MADKIFGFVLDVVIAVALLNAALYVFTKTFDLLVGKNIPPVGAAIGAIGVVAFTFLGVYSLR